MYKYILITLSTLLISYFSLRLFQGVQIFSILSEANFSSGLIRITQADSEYGMVLKPSFLTSNIRPDGVEIEIKTDVNGFRTPMSKNYTNEVDVIGLGCSFMFAENVIAENTFLNQIVSKFESSVFDMSAGGYGYAQMLLRAKEYIPKLKPKVVICENAYWLADRSVDPWSVTTPISISQPFFKKNNGKISIYKPLYRNWIYDMTENIREKKYCPLKLSLNCWYFLVRDDYRKVLLKVQSIFEADKVEKQEAANYFFEQLAKLCKKNGSLLLVVGLEEQIYLPPKNIHFVQTYDILNEYAKSKHNGLNIFQHWYGNPPKMYDAHYNELAHKLIAEGVIKYINDKGLSDYFNSKIKKE